jgi:hypothetical protein
MGGDGTFRVRVPGDRDVTIRVTHPLLVPAVVVAREPRTGLDVRLVRGATATVAIDADVNASAAFRDSGRVLLYRGASDGEPAFEGRLHRDGRTVSFGGFEPGTWTVFLDVAPHAPIVLNDRRLGAGATDLGVVTVVEGARIRVKVLVKDGQHAPRISLTAARRGKPGYMRYLNSNGETEAVLSGLGAGTFEVTARPVMGADRALLETEVTLEAGGEAEIVVDLR